MKTSNNSTIFTGVTLLLLAALFSISLISQALDFSFAYPGSNNILYFLGKVLFSVYGFSSALIPLFLFVAGISCFASKWSARKSVRLLTAIVPFFTAVVTENICRSIVALGDSGFSEVKIFVAVITGMMLIIIEFLGAGIIADKLNPILFGEKKIEKNSEKTAAPQTFATNSDTNVEISEDGKILKETEIHPAEHLAPIGKLNTGDLIFGKENENQEGENPAALENESAAVSKSGVQEEDVRQAPEESSVEEEVSADAAESNVEAANEADSSSITDPEVREQVSNIFEQALSKVQAEEIQNETVENGNAEAAEKEAEADNYEAAVGGSMITEEEYAALTDFSEEPEEELEWNNLPPVQDELPSDYIDDEIDENDPALEFPPKEAEDDEYAEDSAESDVAYEEAAEDSEAENGSENAADNSDDPFSAFEFDSSSAAPADEQTEQQPENAYSAVKYIDSVVENPNFGHGISIRDGSEETAEADDEAEKKNLYEKPKFPSKINLDNSGDDYIEDPTLPFPNFDVKEPYSENEGEIPPQPIDFDEHYEEENQLKVGASSFVPATFEENTTEPELPNDDSVAGEPVLPPNYPRQGYDSVSKNGGTGNVIANGAGAGSNTNVSAVKTSTNTNAGKSFGKVSDVFAEMEDDIRKESLKKLAEQTEAAREELENSEDFSEEVSETDSDAENETVFADIAATENQQSDEDDLENEIPEDSADFEDGKEHDEIFDDESVAFDDEVQSDFSEKDAFAFDDEEPVKQEILANPPKIGNRAAKKGSYVIPSDLLTAYQDDQYWIIDDATKQASLNLKQTLAEFDIDVQIIGIKKGPVVTMFELLPAPGVKLSKIVALQDNIALSLAAQSVRIVAPIPGKQAVGIEVPNRHRSIVGFREIIEMKLDEWNKMAVPVILGKDILGKAQLIDLVKTPHMLIAGATGSGKSVCVNSLILSILYKRSFRDVKMILVDPKVVELKLYNNIPHLLTPVITEPKKAIQALQWCLCEMERRYALLDSMGVRDISSYNQKIKEREIATEKLPYIVVIIDEFADLMATSGKELESIVARLTAMSRAVGIHLVLATQRPSVNVITGLIKANIPSRIAFMVASRTDSNIIIDSVGAEKLLGRGDMLYASAVDPYPVRIQGTFVSDQEVEDVVRTVKEYGEPDYIDDQMFVDDDEGNGDDFELNGNYDGDPLYDQALEIVVQAGKASASYLQRRLSIGYNRAARLVEEMEERGIVGPANGSKPREVIHVP